MMKPGNQMINTEEFENLIEDSLTKITSEQINSILELHFPDMYKCFNQWEITNKLVDSQKLLIVQLNKFMQYYSFSFLDFMRSDICLIHFISPEIINVPVYFAVKLKTLYQ